MPRKKTVTTTVEDQPVAEPIHDVELQHEPIPEEVEGLDDLLQKFSGSKFKLKVYKTPLRGGTEAYCFSTDESLDEDALRDSFGSGKYLVRIWSNGVYADTAVINIAEAVGGDVQSTSSSSDARVYEMMQTYNANLQTMILALINRENPATTNGNGSGGIKELIESVVALNGLTAGKEPVNMLLEGIKLAKSMNGGSSDWKSELLDVAKEVGRPIVTEMVKAKMVSSNDNQSVPRTAIAAGPLPTDQILKSGLDFLKQQMKFMPPELAIEWISSNSGHEQYQQFVRFALMNSFSDFCKIDPELNNEPYKPWFEALHRGIHETFATETDGSVPSNITGPNGDVSDITVDAIGSAKEPEKSETDSTGKSA